MSKTNLILFALLVVAIVALVLTNKGCNTTNQPTRVEINYDSIERVIKSKLPPADTIEVEKVVTRWIKGSTVRDTIYVEGREIPVYLTAPIDTAAILTHYLTQAVTYIDTLRDSSLQVVIQDTIFRNSIVGRGFTYKILRPLTINTYKPDRFQLIASLQFGMGATYTNDINGIYGGADLGLKFKSGTYFSLGYMAGTSHFGTIRVGQVIRLKR